MKKTEKFIVIRSKETGHFLVSYESNETSFAYTANWSEDIQDASTQDIGSLKRNGDKLQKTAEMFNGELLVVNATYELETLNGNEPKNLTEEIEEAKRKHFENFLRGLLAEGEDYETYMEE